MYAVEDKDTPTEASRCPQTSTRASLMGSISSRIGKKCKTISGAHQGGRGPGRTGSPPLVLGLRILSGRKMRGVL